MSHRERAKEDPIREDRIAYEAVVDAYNEDERAMGWYYYLEGRLHVPFTATCRLKRSTSPLKIGDKVKVLGMAPEDDCMSEVHVLIEYGDSELAVPLDQLQCHSRHKGTCEAVADWHYWKDRGYEY
jgi:hypothetical protein